MYFAPLISKHASHLATFPRLSENEDANFTRSFVFLEHEYPLKGTKKTKNWSLRERRLAGRTPPPSKNIPPQTNTRARVSQYNSLLCFRKKCLCPNGTATVAQKALVHHLFQFFDRVLEVLPGVARRDADTGAARQKRACGESYHNDLYIVTPMNADRWQIIEKNGVGIGGGEGVRVFSHRYCWRVLNSNIGQVRNIFNFMSQIFRFRFTNKCVGTPILIRKTTIALFSLLDSINYGGSHIHEDTNL